MDASQSSTNRRFELPADIVTKLRLRDDSAYAQLVDVAFVPLVRFAYGFVGSYDTAQDIVQTVFVRILEQGESFDPKSPIVPYLYAAVRNLSLNTLRDTKTGERVMGKVINETSLDDFSADKTFQSIEEYMAGLTERQATVLRLRFIEQRTIPEISAMLGVSSTAIKNLVNRAIRALRENYR